MNTYSNQESNQIQESLLFETPASPSHNPAAISSSSPAYRHRPNTSSSSRSSSKSRHHQPYPACLLTTLSQSSSSSLHQLTADNSPFYDLGIDPSPPPRLNSFMGQTYLNPSFTPPDSPTLQSSTSSHAVQQIGFHQSSSNISLHSHENIPNKQPSSFFLSPITSNDSRISHDTQTSTSVTELPFSPLLSLPLEILHQIIEIVYYDDNTNSINSNLEKFSKTIPLLLKTLNQLSLRFLYKYAIFNRPHAFDKFSVNLLNQPDIGKYVEFMDWQTFTSIGLGRTGRMNQEIQMVTSSTITNALSVTPNLIEFLASENIQDDLDIRVLDILFNKLPKIQALDFCGASSFNFASAFNELIINDEPIINEDYDGQLIYKKNLESLFKISFHDCSNLSPAVFQKVLPHLTNLRRLDLNHTSINSTLLNESLPHSCRLTHLSLARCSKLTTRDLINFLVNHPAVSNDSLHWLNLQIDSNVVSPLSDVYLLYTLKHLKASSLRYLNLGGLPINNRILHIIKLKFPLLESLTLSHSSIELNDLNDFLKDNTVLKHLDITGCKKINRWNITNLLKTNYYSSLISIEFDYKILYELSAGEYIKIEPFSQSFLDPVVLPHIWKFYDNEGRRAWLYKIEEDDPNYKSIIKGGKNYSTAKFNIQSNLTYYDLETGQKIETKIKKPIFLKYASRKINCSIGYYNLNLVKKKRYLKNDIFEDVWPTEFSQRGIYNYYSLNIK